SFSALIGDIINIDLTLYTEVDLVDVYEGGARADFSNSGSYTFAGAEDPLNSGTMLDVDFQIVPEPATIAFLSLGSLALLRKRRP
ncbi:MAG: PEP-CTERM sorting domain-containing protein, partial [Planctomycetota bacterium]